MGLPPMLRPLRRIPGPKPIPAPRNAMRRIQPTSRISLRGDGAVVIGAVVTGVVATGAAGTGAVVTGAVAIGVVDTGAVVTGIETIG
jgi:hypothetical protein